MKFAYAHVSTVILTLCLNWTVLNAQPAGTNKPPVVTDKSEDTTAIGVSHRERFGTIQLPVKFSELLALKNQTIEAYQKVESGRASEKAIQVLSDLVDIELSLLKMAREQLGHEYEKLIEQYKRAPTVDLNLLAESFFEAGKYSKSVAAYDEILDILRGVDSDSVTEYSIFLWSRIQAAKLAAATPDKQKEYQAAYAAWNKSLGEMKNAPTEAIMKTMQTSADSMYTVGGACTELITIYQQLAQAYDKLGKIKESTKAAEIAFELSEQVVGRETRRYAIEAFNLGYFLAKDKKHKEAAKLYAEASMIEDRAKVEPRSQMITLDSLAAAYRALNDSDGFNSVVGRYRALERMSNLGITELARFVPLDCYVASSFDVAAAMEQEETSFLPREVIQVAVQKQLGINVQEVQTVLGFLTLPITGEAPEWGALVLSTFGSEVKLTLPGEPETVTYKKIEFKKYKDGSQPPLCFVKLSDRVNAIGSQAAIQQVIDAASIKEASPQPIVQQLLTQHAQSSLVAALDVGKVRSIAQAALAQAPPLPEPIEQLKGLISQIDFLGLRATFTKSPSIRLQAMPRAGTDPEEISAMLLNAEKFGAQMALNALEAQAQSADSDMNAAMLAYVRRIITERLPDFEPTVEDGVVTIQAEEILQYQMPVVLGAALLPAIQAARDAATQTQSMNHLKMIGLAFHMYHDTYGSFPARDIGKSGSGLSWRVALLPYLDHLELYNQFHLDEPWDSEHNSKLIASMPPIYRSSSATLEEGRTVFLALDGEGTALDSKNPTGLKDISDGTSNTILVVEADPDSAVVWTKPDDLPFDAAHPNSGMTGGSEGTTLIVFCDGYVAKVNTSDLPAETLKGLATRDGGEVVQLP